LVVYGRHGATNQLLNYLIIIPLEKDREFFTFLKLKLKNHILIKNENEQYISPLNDKLCTMWWKLEWEDYVNIKKYILIRGLSQEID